MQRVETIADLNQLRRQTFAVVFIWVDWAIHAHHSAHTAERMITDWNLKHPSMTMVLSRIDLSEQCGEMWHAVAEWIRSQSISDIGSLMYGGAGSIMWLRSGTIVRYVVNPNTETVSDLVVLMTQCFSGPEPSNAK